MEPLKKYKLDIDVERVIDKVYHTEDMQQIITAVITDYINQVALMSDEELQEDRSEWIKDFGRDRHDDDERIMDYELEADVHTIAIEIEQIRRFGSIIYRKGKINEKE